MNYPKESLLFSFLISLVARMLMIMFPVHSLEEVQYILVDNKDSTEIILFKKYRPHYSSGQENGEVVVFRTCRTKEFRWMNEGGEDTEYSILGDHVLMALNQTCNARERAGLGKNRTNVFISIRDRVFFTMMSFGNATNQ